MTYDLKQMIGDLKAAGLSQTEISRLAGISPMWVSYLARGVFKRPSFDTVQAITNVHMRYAHVANRKAN